MKKFFVIMAMALIVLPGCLKEPECEYSPCGNAAPTAERQAVAAYLADAGITNATEHCSGVYYVIDEPGTGGQPDACTTVRVAYQGWLTNGTQFDANDNFVYNLGSLVLGWRNTIPLLKVGGTIRIYVPPSLAYGEEGRPPTIPGNSILIFKISLLQI